MSDRFFKNPFADYTDGDALPECAVLVKILIKGYVTEIIKHTDPRKPKDRRRSDVYVGDAGIAFMFLKISQSTVSDEYPAMQMAKLYIDSATSALLESKSKKYISLLDGNAGVYCVSAAIGHMMKMSSKSEIKNLQHGLKIFRHPPYLDDGADEMLVGRSGYLLGILWIENQLNVQIINENERKQLMEVVLKSGRNYAEENNLKVPLMFQYHGREYLGAAHGASAILMVLLALPLGQRDLKDVKMTIDAILDLQTSEGNFPSKFDKPEANLVHWCHGASGIVYLMAAAYKKFGDEKYLKSCIKCSNVVWKYGLLKKGPGICHGIAGNGYVHLLLYRLTKAPKYLYRAIKFAEFLETDEFKSNSRTPDRPYSLFEGMSGAVCFLLDLLEPEKSLFPFMLDVFVFK